MTPFTPVRPDRICVPVGVLVWSNIGSKGETDTSESVTSLLDGKSGSGEADRDREGERTGDALRELENRTPDSTRSSRFWKKFDSLVYASKLSNEKHTIVTYKVKLPQVSRCD